MLNALQDHFRTHHGIDWMNLSRFTSLLIILNISLFFVTELVTRAGYFYTNFSLLALLAVKFTLLVPLGLLNKLWYYGIRLASVCIALYFLISRVWFWVGMNKV
jgi:hypothetical protein